MNKPKIKIGEVPGFSDKIAKCAESGKPYTITLEIMDSQGGRYATEFDMLEGGFNSEAMTKCITACFHLCDAMPVSVLLQNVKYMATA